MYPKPAFAHLLTVPSEVGCRQMYRQTLGIRWLGFQSAAVKQASWQREPHNLLFPGVHKLFVLYCSLKCSIALSKKSVHTSILKMLYCWKCYHLSLQPVVNFLQWQCQRSLTVDHHDRYNNSKKMGNIVRMTGLRHRCCWKVTRIGLQPQPSICEKRSIYEER